MAPYLLAQLIVTSSYTSSNIHVIPWSIYKHGLNFGSLQESNNLCPSSWANAIQLWQCLLTNENRIFYAPSTFLRITRDKCSFSCHAMPHAKSLFFSSSSHSLLCPKQLPKSFSQNECSLLLLTWRWWPNDCWERISDNTATQRPRSGYCVGRVSECHAVVLLWQHLQILLSYFFGKFLWRRSNMLHSLCEKFHLLCRHPLRSVVEVRSSYHSGSFVRRLDASRGLGRRFIIVVWGQEKNFGGNFGRVQS